MIIISVGLEVLVVDLSVGHPLYILAQLFLSVFTSLKRLFHWSLILGFLSVCVKNSQYVSPISHTLQLLTKMIINDYVPARL